MKVIQSLIETPDGIISGAMVGPSPDSVDFLTMDSADWCPRSELATRATDLCRKYGLQPSPKMAEALAKALTPPVPDGA